MEHGSRIRESLALAYWARVVGPQVAEASVAEEVRNGLLFIRTKASVWSQEISLLKYRILPELNRLIGRPVIKDIRFRVSRIPPKPPPEPEPPTPTDDELAQVRLNADEQGALDRDLAALGGIADSEFRDLTRRTVSRQRRLNRWRLEHGWRVCSACPALHREAGDLCPICAVAA